MTRTRYVLVAVGVLLVWSLAVPTGGVSSTSIDRGIDGEVASDDEAYLGIESECGNDTVTVTVANRFGGETVLDIDVTANGTTETIDDLAPEESETVTFDANGTSSATLTALGSGVSIRLERSLPTGC